MKCGKYENMKIRSSHPKVLLKKDVLKICNKFTAAHPNRNVISIKLLCSFIEILLRHGCSPFNLLHIFRTPFTKNTSGRLLFENLNKFCETIQKMLEILIYVVHFPIAIKIPNIVVVEKNFIWVREKLMLQKHFLKVF